MTMKIYDSLEQLIGNTPLLSLDKYCEKHGVGGTILAKLEYFNPAGSAKDRVGKAMLDDAEERGLLAPGGTIIEPTSGNTGIGIASVAASRGYRTILTMPDTMSVERRNLLRAFGAELVLTEGAKGMQGAIDKANELHDSIPGSFIPGQFDNPANPAVHEKTTGPEIWRDTEGRVDAFVAGIGTGGTITGTARYLKAMNAEIKVIGMEPADSPLLTKGYAGGHKLQGIGANFVPAVLDTDLLDEILTVTTEQAYDTCKELSRLYGLLVGVSSGAAVYAAMEYASRPENAGKTIVALLPDGGDRYLSTPGFME